MYAWGDDDVCNRYCMKMIYSHMMWKLNMFGCAVKQFLVSLHFKR